MDELAQHFADLATNLLQVRSVDETMALIVHGAVDTIEGCDHASLSYVRDHELVSASSNDDVGPLLDRIQTETGEGPCLAAIHSAEIQELSDLSASARFPDYCARAVEESDVRSTIASPLVVASNAIGALNLFSNRAGTFDPNDAEQAALIAIFVAHSAPAFAAARERERSEAALRTRDLIGQAKGILMARSGLNEDEAFDILRRASQRLNVKLRDVAEQVARGQPLDAAGVDASPE